MTEIHFKKTELNDRELIQNYFGKYSGRSCERTFVNCYLWSVYYPVTFAIVEDTLVFRSTEDGTEAFSYPAGEPKQVQKTLEVLEQYTKERGLPFELYMVTEEQFEQLEKWYPGRFEIEYDRDYADYIYESQALASLAGKKLHGKRNHINQFLKQYEDWQYEPMSAANLQECREMAEKWRVENGCDEDEEKSAEICITLNALKMFEALSLTGGALRVNGEIVAFTMGEPLSEDTFVVHIEKAFADVPGAYPMINREFVRNACMDYKYINREEDTGAEGLRKAKLSYHPAFLVQKGTVKEKVQ